MKEKISSRIKRLYPRHVFLMCSIPGIISFFVVCIFGRQHMLQWLAMGNRSVTLCDYFMYVINAGHRKEIYSLNSTMAFPPFAYMLYYYIMRITTNNAITDIAVDLRTEPYQLMIFLMFLTVGVVLLIRAIDELDISRIEKNFFAFVILFSAPVFAGAIERGNITLHTVALLLIAYLWKDSELKWKREVALFCIAFAAGIKVYPAIVGLLYLRERRYKEALRLIIYGMIIFFVPFVFFGGLSSIKQYIELLTGLMNRAYYGRFQFIKGLLNFMGIEGALAAIGTVLFMAMLIAGIFFTHVDTRRASYVAAFMTLVPGNAFRYSLMFFLLPLFALTGKSKYAYSKEDYIDSVLLGLVFTIPTFFGCATYFRLKNEIYSYSYVELRLYVVAWIYLFVQFFYDAYDLVKKQLIIRIGDR